MEFMPEEKRHKWTVSPFTAILLMVALSVAGIASAPLLNIQYTPTAPGREVEVSFRYPDASAQVVEGEITSPLEGVLSALGGITEVSSVSQKGSGSVRVRFAKGKDMDAARFEVHRPSGMYILPFLVGFRIRTSAWPGRLQAGQNLNWSMC